MANAAAMTTAGNSGKPTTCTINKPRGPMRVGQVVSIPEKIAWVKIPSSCNSEIRWWPGVLYQSFEEFSSDISEFEPSRPRSQFNFYFHRHNILTVCVPFR